MFQRSRQWIFLLTLLIGTLNQCHCHKTNRISEHPPPDAVEPDRGPDEGIADESDTDEEEDDIVEKYPLSDEERTAIIADWKKILEPREGSKRSKFSGRWLRRSPPKDKNGNRPRDILLKFFEAVMVGDYDLARTFWAGEYNDYSIGGPDDPPDPNAYISFCHRYRVFDAWTIKHAIKQKSIYWNIEFTGFLDGKILAQSSTFYFHLVEDEWYLSRGSEW